MNAARNIAKTMEATEQKVGNDTFYIYPLSAFTAANLSGEVVSLLAPLVGGIVGAFKESDKKSLMDIDVTEAAPHIASAFSTLSSDRMESLLRKLLMNNNVAVLPGGSSDVHWLTEDICNQIFCGNVQNMFVLAFHVIKVNYKDFFESFGNLSGIVKDNLMKIVSPDTELSTPQNLTN